MGHPTNGSSCVEEEVHGVEGVVQAAIEDVTIGPCGHLTIGVQPIRQLVSRGASIGVFTGSARSTHELGEVVRGEVVRTNGVPVRVPGEGVVRIVGLAQNPPNQSPLGLGHGDHEAAGPVDPPLVDELTWRPAPP